MTAEEALAALAALSNPTRLETFRLLVRREPTGLTTGEIVSQIGITQSTLSTHLAVLAKAKLVRAEKQGRNQVQHAEVDTLRELMLFLAKDCCSGSPQLCDPLIAELTCR